MAFIRWIIGFIIALILAAFAVNNRQSVELLWSPVHPTIELPLYIIALGYAAFGFILGGAVVWINAGSIRREKRQQKKQIKELEKKLETIEKEETAIKEALATTDFPALPSKTGTN